MAHPSSKGRPLAAIFGSAGPVLSAEETAFFKSADPLGFILFARNCQSPEQVAALVAAMRAAVGRPDAPVLIDQEGGRVQRLGPPHWPARPAQGAFAAIARSDLARGLEAANLNARLIAAELIALGIDVDCLPVLDVPAVGADGIIGDRAYGTDPEVIAAFGRAVVDGLMAGGVMPIIKHIPGHGRAMVDSHKALPVVDAPRSELAAIDFAPFRANRTAPWAMTAHVVYTAIDPDHPATLSKTVIGEVIRGEIGFDGLLLSDDINMKALAGGIDEIAAAAIDAGCDVALHCNGDLDEMRRVAAHIPPMSDAAWRRFTEGRAGLGAGALDTAAAEAHLQTMLSGVTA